MIQFHCPRCNEAMSVPEYRSGVAEKCSHCGNVTYVPPVEETYGASAQDVGSQDEEKLLWTGKPSRLNNWVHFAAAGLCIAVGLLIFILRLSETFEKVPSVIGWSVLLVGVVVWIWLEFLRRFTCYRITSQMVTRFNGVLSRQSKTIPVAHVREVSLDQSIVQRIMNVGKLGFSTSASTGLEVVFDGVSRPREVQELVRSLLR